MKKLFMIISMGGSLLLNAQDNYCDFEGMKKVSFAAWNGSLDTNRANPNANPVNMSATCAKYIRDTALYDNIKLFPYNKLSDITSYANSSPSAPKMTMKVYSSAAPGTSINIQLGSRTTNAYPAGIHSEYVGVTTLKNAWQLVTFNYQFSPSGGFSSATDIDKVIVLFNPNSHARDTIYFDDPTGPPLLVLGAQELDPAPAKIFQNRPNPASDNTNIRLQINTSGTISLKIYDVLGKQISSLLDGEMNSGNYNIPVNTSQMPNGIYFCILRADGMTQSKRIIVAR